MAFNKDQNEPKIPISNVEKRNTSDLLPRFYRTKSNKKFLQATLDQLTQPGTVKKLNGYIGRETAKAVTSNDVFLAAASKERQDYQLEPAAAIQDYLGNTTFFKDYIDHINHIKTFDGNIANHARINKEEFYSWNPNICWDKFVNFQQYYWLPFGPSPIEIFGQQLEIISTFTVKGVDEEDNVAYLFTPNGLTRNPTLRLFRGQTYRFDIDAEGHPFSIKFSRKAGTLDRYTEGVDGFAIEKGIITFTVSDDAPDVLYYVSENAVDTGGVFHILDIEENTSIDLEQDFLGKKTYIVPNGTAKGLQISNGMKVSFGGQVIPEQYSEGFWYVEGVGTSIKLINEKDLEIRTSYKEEAALLFDDVPFDQLPFGDASVFPSRKDYITINRGSMDKNPWSRYNRWFHQDVIIASAAANSAEAELDQTARAIRPIIEFNAGIKLHNYGISSKKNIDVIDTFTRDVFSIIEGSIGYNVDGIDLADGMRILFTADPDRFVKNKIFKVNFITVTPPERTITFNSATAVDITNDRITFAQEHGLSSTSQITYLTNDNAPIGGLTNRKIYYINIIDTVTIELYTDQRLTKRVDLFTTSTGTHKFDIYAGRSRQINLVEEPDSEPVDGETVSVNYGTTEEVAESIRGNQGQTYWFNGNQWKLAQIKYTVNQPPLFDLFDEDGDSFSDFIKYDGSTFSGNKIFSYKVGTGIKDKELNFPLSYLNINNIGDIVFEFNLLTEQFAYKKLTDVIYKNTDVGFLKISDSIVETKFENGWKLSSLSNTQPVVRVFKEHNYDGTTKPFPIDTFDGKENLDDLEVRVYINSKRLPRDQYRVQDGVVRKELVLDTAVSRNDIVTLRCFTKKAKNKNGYYEIPISLQNNPLNNNIEQFTLGQVIDHVDSIIDNIMVFEGQYPGNGNLRDIGNLTPYGTRFAQHSGPMNLSLYHMGSKSANIIKALDQARNDYGKFKRAFIVAATESGIDTDPKRHVDFVLQSMSQDKPNILPYYLSDMFGYAASNRIEYTIIDPRIKTYPLTEKFTLSSLSNKAVNIYLNGEQLLHGRDYVFGDDVFFEVLINLEESDLLEAYEYVNTDGCYCPPTPTKLGLYPLFEPKIFEDDSYSEPTNVIRGHDGSITVAFNDYRDQLLLELEKRIFNNVKVEYDTQIFDVFDFIPGYNRQVDYNKQEFDQILSKYFFQWTLNIQQDYTKHIGYDSTNAFTYNYRGKYTPDNKDVPAAWRGIYKWLLDTDCPHLRPWEMLGFSIEPKWWTDAYGPAPYTSDNLILWGDLRDGIVREPAKPLRRNPKFFRPILDLGSPVDDQGNLLSPYDTNYLSGAMTLGDDGYFVFGDESVVETAWRRSSYYPFALLETILLMRPNEVLGKCIDRSRIIRNLDNQLIYKDTGKRVRLEDLILPSVSSSYNVSFTAGLINYIIEYLTSESTSRIESYARDLLSLTNKISTRVGSFTTESKYKILLDSKTPSSSGGVFVPEENYYAALNVSSAVEKIVYSGVLITKYANGFELRGYNFNNPYFIYYPYLQDDRIIRVGGISESYVIWESGKLYVAGKLVRANNQFYRVKVNHTSGTIFDTQYYARLSELPIVGGREAMLRKEFDNTDPQIIAYGTRLSTIQEVVDFLQGYGAYLEDIGFVFDDFNNELATVTDWLTSVNEFLFWTTQQWGEGSAISLSPAASRLIFRSTNSVVDNLLDQFYGYSIFRVDGQKLDPEFTTIYRSSGEFVLEPENTNHGIYGATLFLVQKEHVIIIDNNTLFNDTIYDPEAGYRQERIKIIGYAVSGWNGGFEIPGFIYDEAIIKEWQIWTDYKLGDIVKYKEFYYSATKFLVGTEKFESSNWILIEEKPEPRLISNWDYKAETFTDFYDLDTDSFDADQQKIAQHLIGYQKRQYLENIIKNDVSQYKFYQGMIIEKGTQNVLNKLFDTLSADDQESLTFDEEWAFRIGEYGSIDSFSEIEIILNESQFKINPQPVEFVDTIDPEVVDFVYRQRPSDIYIKPQGYKNELWPVKNSRNFLRTSGYVRSEDVKISIDSLEDLIQEDISNFREGDYVWCAFEGKDWNVYRLTRASFKILNVSYNNSVVTVEANKLTGLNVGDYIGIENSEKIKGFHRVSESNLKIFKFSKKIEGWQEFEDRDRVLIYVLTIQRVANIDDANSVITDYIKPNEIVWADDNGQGKWAAYKNSPVYRKSLFANTDPATGLNFGFSVATSEDGTVCAIADDDRVTIYEKDPIDGAWNAVGRIDRNDSLVASATFASVLKISKDRTWLAIASPDATSVNGSGFNQQGYVLLYRRSLNGNYRYEDLLKINLDEALFGTSIAFGRVSSDEQFYTNLTNSYIGNGKNAAWNVVREGSQYSLIIVSRGFNYSAGETITITGNQLGGIAPDNDLIITIKSVDNLTGAIANFEYEGQGPADTYLVAISSIGPGVGASAGRVDIFEFTSAGWLASPIQTITSPAGAGGIFGYDLSMTRDGKTLIVSAPGADNESGRAYVYSYSSLSGTYSLSQTLSATAPDDAERFGESVAISSTGGYIAVGSNLMNVGNRKDVGQILVYKLDSTYMLSQIIDSPNKEVNERFGSDIDFMNDDQTIIAFSTNGDVGRVVSFDENTTVFDNDSLKFIDLTIDAGRIDVFDRYNTDFIYGESLDNATLPFSNYGKELAVGNNIVITSAYNETDQGFEFSGKVYLYEKSVGATSWEDYYTRTDKIDTAKIKKAFIYNKASNQLVTYLDIVDPIQGKIPGIADQEIKFKTFFDPATYSVGNSSVTVDDGMNWTEKHVGMLWWDLTRAKFLDSQSGDIVYRSSIWNRLYNTASIDIYEWVESNLLPSAWNKLADTEKGLSSGISGTTKYSDEVYSVKKRYDSISRTFKETYYYWVKNTKIVPDIEGRTLSADNISKLISDPSSYGYSCLAFLGPDSFSLVNVRKYLDDNNLVLNVQYWDIDDTTNNFHSQWKLLSTNRNTSIPAALESKWLHSLIGKDDNDRVVPDINLPVKQRFGVEFRPRQSMFVNRIEALKQFIERVNDSLETKLIADDYDLTDLDKFEPEPSKITGTWDITIDTDAELRFIPTILLETPVLSPIIIEGRIVDINIVNPGYGYGKLRTYSVDQDNDPISWYGPDVIIKGTGKDAAIKTVIDSQGSIINAIVVDNGEGYDYKTVTTVRPFSVLVKNDASALDRWSIYQWNFRLFIWDRVRCQSYDVRKYWEYLDWYESGYNQFVKINHLVENTYELVTTGIDIGSVAKVKNIGSGGWLLLEKYADNQTIDYTENFKVIGREKGTIRFLSNLYQYQGNNLGYDGPLFDSDVYDNTPSAELKIILNSIKDKILVDEFRPDYLALFFASVRYALHEQTFVDWAFKTSFVKGQHNVGELKQKVTYNSDNLEFFEDFIKEVKPYRTKIREYVSNYSKLDLSQSAVSDFDLLPVINEKLEVNPLTVYVNDQAQIISEFSELGTYPWKYWNDCVGFEITEIKIIDGGEGYTTNPVVRFIGEQLSGGTAAEAKAYISNGVVNRIDLIKKGSRWIKAPEVIIDGGAGLGRSARAVAIIGNSIIRSNHVKMKFDRISKMVEVTDLKEIEIFSGAIISGSRTEFNLKWSPDLSIGSSYVTIDGAEVLRGDYTLQSIKSTGRGYTSYSGKLKFTTPPAAGSIVLIEYTKDFNHLSATDRINFYYDPRSGQIGKDLSQLMTGVDYGGVQITGIDFNISVGWDALPWFTDVWDASDPTLDDYLVTVGASSYKYVESVSRNASNIATVTTSKNHGYVTGYLVYIVCSVSSFDTGLTGVSITVTGPKTFTYANIGPVQGTTTATGKILAYTYSFRLPYIPIADQQINVYISRYTESPEVNIIDQEIISVAKRQLLIVTDNPHNLVRGQFASITDVVGAGANYQGSKKVIQIISDVRFVIEIEFPIVLGTGGKVKASRYDESIRIDDPNYLTINQTNENALMTTFVGDGEIDIVTLPSSANLDVFDRITFRKISSDGSSNIRSNDYDTLLSGGELAGYSTATGLSPDDIILEGDDLITPMSSFAPEEVVPGHVLDTLAIKVYHRPSGGCPNIMFSNHFGDGITTRFKIGQYFADDKSVIVKTNNIKSINTDYEIDYKNNEIVFATAPVSRELISILSISLAAENLLDLDYFVADGETDEYITKAPWFPNISSTVLVDGEFISYELFSTDDNYTDLTGQTWRSRVGIRFVDPPSAGSIIYYMIDFSNTETTASIVRSETVTYTTSNTYPLTNLIGTNKPFESNVLVKTNQTFLKPPSYNYFTMQDNNLVYSLRDYKYMNFILNSNDILVYKGTELLVAGSDYTIDFDYRQPSYSLIESSLSIIGGTGYIVGETIEAVGGDLGPSGAPAKFEILLVNGVGTIQRLELIDAGSYVTPPATSFDLIGGTGTGAKLSASFEISQDYPNISIEINPRIYDESKKLIVSVIKIADYFINDNNSITFVDTYANGTVFEILSFYNHNVLGIERTTDILIPAVSISSGTAEYYELSGKLGGIFRLRQTVVSGDFVWIIKNGDLLMHNVDYYIEDDFITIRLAEYLYPDDEVQVMAFTNTVVHETFAYMQFKDMLNRVHYKRLNKSKSTMLDKDLTQLDREITVVDASKLDLPNPAKNLPGIIEINGERIEYFVKDGNKLSQLRRGTLGTGIPYLHSKDSLVQCIGPSETIPYKDRFEIISQISDGIANPSGGHTVRLSYIPSPNDIEVFVGGHRLKKTEYKLYSNEEYPYSPEGDVYQNQDEFGVPHPDFEPTVRTELELFNVPDLGVKITVIRKQGKLWNDLGKRLAKSDNPVANFLKETGADWPEAILDKYEDRVLGGDGNPLQTGDGEPLEY